MVGISLLTLVPRISGGSETYARELVRALARVGRLEYHVFAPTLAPDAIDGLPGTTVKTYAASEADLQQATGKVVESVLTIYQDILSEEGVAGDIQGLTPEVEDTDDEDAE